MLWSNVDMVPGNLRLCDHSPTFPYVEKIDLEQDEGDDVDGPNEGRLINRDWLV